MNELGDGRSSVLSCRGNGSNHGGQWGEGLRHHGRSNGVAGGRNSEQGQARVLLLGGVTGRGGYGCGGLKTDVLDVGFDGQVKQGVVGVLVGDLVGGVEERRVTRGK